MSLPDRGRPRSVVGVYNLRSDLVPPLRFAEDYPPVKPGRGSRNSAGMNPGIPPMEDSDRTQSQLITQAGLMPLVCENTSLASSVRQMPAPGAQLFSTLVPTPGIEMPQWQAFLIMV